MRLSAIILIALCHCATAIAQEVESTRILGDYQVHFSVFNSQYVPADIASIHKLVRGKDQALINITVQEAATGKAVAARVSGHARNLLQQLKPLEFKAIEEPGAHYSIASLRHSNEEVFHFIIDILPPQSARPLRLEFNRKLYMEQ